MHLPVYLSFKSERAKERFLMMHPLALMIAFDMLQYARVHKLPFLITETVTTVDEDIVLQRKHAVHRERRGFDLSIYGWSEGNIATFVGSFNKKYDNIAAVSSESLKNELVVYKKHGTGPHLHIQINARYKE